jgi:UDP-MurNAc hydroxylase
MLIETDHGSIVCDPWFVPAFFGSWFVFPRNDQLGDELMAKIRDADYLYVSHLHGDHFDEVWLADERNIRRDIGVIVPGYPSRELDQRLRALGFTNLIRTVDGEEYELDVDGLTVAIHVETSITDGPGGDSALVVTDGTSRIVNQNDCRTTDLAALAAHGPVDLHWLQYSGAIWYPMVYEMDAATMRHLVDAKVESQLTRAMRYVESINARAVVPSAGPPCFLDDDLYHLNVVDGDEPSIFVDQRTFLARLAASGHEGVLAIPGTAITVDAGAGAITVEHPIADADVAAIFERKGEYLAKYQADWAPWLASMHETWAAQPDTDVIATLQEWWRPLLAACPTVREGIGAACLLRAGDVEIVIDFPAGDVRRYGGENVGFRFDIDRSLVEKVVAERAVDWSNSLFLSCRFRAWRAGEFNEYIYNFFKSLSPGRMRRTEAEALRKLHPPTGTEPDIELDGWVMQRRCPHRNADLSVFGEVHDCELVCTMHGWRFDLETGKCLTSAGHPLRVRRASDPPAANTG